MRLYWTDERPRSGWLLQRLDDGTYRAEELGGPRALTAPTLPGLIQQLASDEAALQRRFTETQIRTAATAINCDPNALATQLRAMAA